MIVEQINELTTYLDGMMSGRDFDDYPRIDHADGVRGAVLAVVGGIMWRADPGSVNIRDREGRLSNMAWITVDGHRYAIVYARDPSRIEIRHRSQQGEVLFVVDDDTPAREVWEGFASLGEQAATQAA